MVIGKTIIQLMFYKFLIEIKYVTVINYGELFYRQLSMMITRYLRKHVNEIN